MGSGNRALIIYISVSTAIILWGFSFIWTNQILHLDIPIFTFITVRMAIAGVVLLLVSSLLRKLQKIRKKDIPFLLIMSMFEPFIYFIGESFGLKYTNSPTICAVLIATIPIFVMIAGQIFFKEKISKLNVFAVIITVPGILLIVLKTTEIAVDYWYGILFLIIAVFAATGYSIMVKKLSDRYNSYTIATWQFILAAIYFLPLYLIFDSSKMPIGEIFRVDVMIPLLSLALLCSCLSFVLYINSIQYLGVTRASVFSTMTPAVSAFGAYIMGHETFTPLQILGLVIVILGVIFTQYRKQAQ
jgi:Permeases of the drug/metabolite transporter (DMT) superfamily